MNILHYCEFTITKNIWLSFVYGKAGGRNVPNDTVKIECILGEF